MTKTELQTAIAEATQTNKRTAGVLIDTLSALAYINKSPSRSRASSVFGLWAASMSRETQVNRRSSLQKKKRS
jgi:hypothetical protein